jgi:hypothetical protein
LCGWYPEPLEALDDDECGRGGRALLRVASDVKEDDDELLDARCCEEVGR